jgi:LacI family transcriptional regulator, repressor for deo operon, udp, cdd, tsx, nupC, and nupG
LTILPVIWETSAGHSTMRKKTNSGRPRTDSLRMERRAYNIREVAKIARTSVATVSRSLRHSNVVAPETRKRVLAAIERLGYTPSAQPGILRTARTNVIVALVPDISNPFFAEVIRGIEQIAHRNGYSVLLGDTQYDQTREADYSRLVATKQADGMITLLPRIPPTGAGGPIPIVNACEYFKDPSVTSVFVDNAAAARQATAFLITLGHRQIAFLSGPMNTPICIDRDAGYESALRAAGLVRNRQLTVNGDFSVESGIRGVKSLFASGRKFTALFCSNDEMAIGAIHAVKAHGLRVPEDVSVIGFDDIRFARYTDPPLTTVAQPKKQLGCEAMTLLLQILRNNNTPPQKRVLPTELIVRSSTGAPRHP